MKNQMDQKVDQMRSQSMSFSNNGMEISINVPDTVDVKSAFGTIIGTVVQQQDEITHMNHQMQKIAEEHAQQQRSIVAWAQRCMLKLEEQNQSLKKHLVESQMQIKNLTYNMQGFVDPMTKKDKILDSEILSEVAVEPPPDMKERHSHPMFPTEDGADLHAGFDMQSDRHEGTRFHKSMTKKIAARDFYYSVGPNVLPNRRSPAKRWRWAIQKVLHLARSQKIKAGFTRTRLEHSQTVVERLNRLEQVVFQLPIDVHESIGSESKRSGDALKKEISRLESVIENLKQHIHNKDMGLQQQLALIEDRIADISTVAGASTELISHALGDPEIESNANHAVDHVANQAADHTTGHATEDAVISDNGTAVEKRQVRSANKDQYLNEKLQLVERNVREIIQLDFTRSKMGIEYAVTELQNIEQRATTALQSISFITNSLPSLTQPRTEKDEIRYLTEVLRLDTQLRAARTEISSIEGGLLALEGVYRTTQQHIELLVQHQGHHDRLLGGGSSRLAGSELQSMLLSCGSIESLSRQVHQSVTSMKVLSESVDSIIGTRWKALDKFETAIGEIDSINKSITHLQKNVSVISSSAAELAERQKLLEDKDHETLYDRSSVDDTPSHLMLARVSNRLAEVEDMLESLRNETQSFAHSTQEMIKKLPQSLMFSEDDSTQTNDMKDDDTQTDFDDMYGDWQHYDHRAMRNSDDERRIVDKSNSAQRKKYNIHSGNKKNVNTSIKHADDQDELFFEDHGDQLAHNIETEPVDFDDSLIESAISNGTAAGIAAAISTPTSQRHHIKHTIEHQSSSRPRSAISRPASNRIPVVLHSGGDHHTHNSKGRDFDGNHDRPSSKTTSRRSDSGRVTHKNQGNSTSEHDADEFATNKTKQKKHSGTSSSRPSSANYLPTNPFSTAAASRPSSANLENFEVPNFNVLSSVEPRIVLDYDREPASTDDDMLAAFFNPSSTANRNQRGAVDGNDLLEEVHNISKIIRTITIRLDDVNRNKMGSEQAVALFRAMAKEQRLKDRGGGGDNRSVDSLSLDMDKHVQDIVQEMRHMKSEHDRHLKGLKDYLEQAIEFAVNKTMVDVDAGRDASANTRALCLGCGRNSTYKLHPSPTRPDTPQSNSFLPALNSSSTPGPDIYRGGFRLPVRVSSASHKKPFSLEDDEVRVTGQTLGNAPFQIIAGINEIVGEEALDIDSPPGQQESPNVTLAVAPTTGAVGPPSAVLAASKAAPNASTQQRKQQSKGSNSANISTSQSQPLLRQTAAAVLAQEALPIFRKGFPGKKSLRAETAYAPERFDLQLNAQQQPLLTAVKPNKTNKLSSMSADLN